VGALYVIVPSCGGAPLAWRLGPAVPRVQLSGLDVMAGPATLVAGQSVLVVARVSTSGKPEAGSGDLFGELRYRVGRDGARRLLIDQTIP
jgi:hypothetical protein